MLSQLGIALPVLAAPMAGGPTTAAMVIAAGRAGSLGMVAAGYKTVHAVEEQLRQVRAESIPFGVNVFAPNPLPVDAELYRWYADEIQRDAVRFGLTLPTEPIEDDDSFDDKIQLLLDDPVPLVSFTFGIPSPRVIKALQEADTIVVQTVTNRTEATAARDAGVDALAVQAHTAGGHSGTLTPTEPLVPTPITTLVAEITRAVELPVIAGGGLATPQAVAEVIHAGAAAAVVGTVLLRATESGASPTHQAALVDPARTETVLTRAFTGRPARGLRSGLVRWWMAG
nr:nitronate monooxygenase [Mycobacterium gordonae]